MKTISILGGLAALASSAAGRKQHCSAKYDCVSYTHEPRYVMRRDLHQDARAQLQCRMQGAGSGPRWKRHTPHARG